MTKASLGWVAVGFLATSPLMADVKGLYGTDCLAAEGLSAARDLLFEDAVLENVQTVFSDQSCEHPAYDFSFSGPYQIHNETGALDYKIESIKFRVLDPRIVEVFNEAQLCGFTDWSVNVAHEVAGLDCGGKIMPEANTSVFDRIRETEASTDHGASAAVQLGLASGEHNAQSKEQRPLEFDELPYFAK